jgi:iron(III) transport system ATP-binding protein
MISVRNLHKKFSAGKGELKAVNNTSFEVSEGKFLSIVGPSGCGKTTTLRCIAGLERPDMGEIEVNGVVVYSFKNNYFLPPHQRKIGMVFQSYAIWPHMNVFDNAAFPLRISRKVPKKKMIEQVEKALKLVHFDKLKDRPATDLSGGQQQRLALARAIVGKPRLLLLDEPLSNLDTKLRFEMRTELKRVQKTLGITTVYVTHDQGEALSMADIMGVMNAGRIIQLDDPKKIYEHPANEFVADFIGSANLIPGTVVASERGGTNSVVETPYGRIRSSTSEKPGTKVFVSIKPEDIELSPCSSDGPFPKWIGTVGHVSFLGGFVDYQVYLNNLSLNARLHPSISFNKGDRVHIAIKRDRQSIILNNHK